MWVLLALLYGFFIGCFSLTRKQMLKKSDGLVAAALYSLVSFVFIIWEVGFIFPMQNKYIALLFIKSIIVTCAMYFSILALKKLEVSKATILSCLSIVLTFFGGMLIFSEKVSVLQSVGASIVLLGIILVSISKKNKQNYNVCQQPQQNYILPIIYALLASFFDAASSLMDKYLLQHITVFQMQFWFLLFVMIMFWVLLIIVSIRKKEWLIKKTNLKNIWIYISGILLIVGDLCLFWAYACEGSMVSVIVVLSKLSLIVAFIGGIIFFKESKNWYKFVYFGFIIIGLVLLSI